MRDIYYFICWSPIKSGVFIQTAAARGGILLDFGRNPFYIGRAVRAGCQQTLAPAINLDSKLTCAPRALFYVAGRTHAAQPRRLTLVLFIQLPAALFFSVNCLRERGVAYVQQTHEGRPTPQHEN